MLKLHESEIPTLSDNEQVAITKLKSLLREKLNVVKLILFGSKARGDYEKDSDVDLMVIVDHENVSEVRDELSDIQFEVVLETDADLMCKIESLSNWQCNDESEYIPLKGIIQKEGIEIEI